jgi:choline monooxygenase
MLASDYQFDEQLATASTLPSNWYIDPAILQLEKENVFNHTWQLVGRTDQVSEPGDFFTAMIADEPVLVVRGSDEKLRAFSNVCRHRAGPVAAGTGNRKVFQCGYHGWTYSLDGRLQGAPEFEGVERFDKSTTCLPEFRVDTWGPLVFVNIDKNCAPLSVTLEDLPSRIKNVDMSSMVFAQRKDWFIDCNWKTYVDNYLEGYHIPIVHPSLNREIDYPRYRTETKSLYSIQHSPIKRERAVRLAAPTNSEDDAALFVWIYPNLMINVYADNFSTNLIVPLGPERTLTIFEWYFLDPEKPGTQEALRRAVEFSDEIQLEDIAICETVQRGLRSSTYSQGRYSVKRENGVHHFHGLLAKHIA